MKFGVKRIWLAIVFLALCMALGVRCARVLAPEGGPKDVNPPRMLRAKPENFTANFTGTEVRIYFDEMVVSKDFQKKVQVSPPLKFPLTATDKGKSVSLKIKDTLRENSTYRIDLSDVIVDLTEGNKTLSCVYVFSTGSRIDSGLVVGVARDAFTHNPVENVEVQLYATDALHVAVDSFPDGVARAREDGTFRVENLPKRAFQTVALVDINANRKYDLPTEKIAFLDSTVWPIRMPRYVDTLGSADTIQVAKNDRNVSPAIDSTAAAKRAGLDSVLAGQKERENAARVLLNIFSYVRPKQMLVKRERPEAGMLRFIFACPPEGEVRMEPVAPEGISFVEERSKRGDTIILWAQNELTRDADTLFLHVHSLKSDSLNALKPWIDTVRLGFKQKKKDKAQKGSKGTQNSDTVAVREPLVLQVLNAAIASAIKPGDTLIIRSQQPFATLDSSKLRLISNADTTEYPYSLVRFENRPRDVGITAQWPIDSAFTMVIDSGAIFDHFGACNDSTAFSWRTYRPSDYSTLHFNLIRVPKPCILQLYTEEKEKKTVREVFAREEDGRVSIRYLNPGTYLLRIVDDRNGDGRWTTGDYESQRQPESVRYFVTKKGEKEIKVRANWEYDIDVDYSILEE